MQLPGLSPALQALPGEHAVTTLAIATMFPLATVAAGDEANATALARRAHLRGIETTLTTVNTSDVAVEADVYLLGGDGLSGVADLVSQLRRTDLRERVLSGRAMVFAVDAGMVALCRSWQEASGVRPRGLGLVDADVLSGNRHLETVATIPQREIGLPAMVGWRSAALSISRGPEVRSLCAVQGVKASSPWARDGVVTDRVIGTQLHGPVLSLNPELADLILSRVMGAPVPRSSSAPHAEEARARRIAEVIKQK
jgi:CobQ-like glutamine amidotransferase family enzyme